jgi:hypothetical protein
MFKKFFEGSFGIFIGILGAQIIGISIFFCAILFAMFLLLG